LWDWTVVHISDNNGAKIVEEILNDWKFSSHRSDFIFGEQLVIDLQSKELVRAFALPP
jgi:hypothetical protein